MGSKKKNLLNLAFLLTVFSLTIWAVFRGEDLHLVFSYVKTANPVFLLLGVVCVVTFILGESVIICYLLRVLGYKVRPPDAISILSSDFSSAVSPPRQQEDSPPRFIT